MREISNLIMVGIVDGLNFTEGTIRATFPDRDDMVKEDIKLLSSELNYPKVGESVLCVFLPNGLQEGFCIGTYYNDQNLPPVKGNVYAKKIDDGLTIVYDYSSKKLTINSQNEIAINSNVSINGNLVVSGTIN